MAKRKVLRHRVSGAIFGWNAAMAKNPKVETVTLDLNKPESKPDPEPEIPSVDVPVEKAEAIPAPTPPAKKAAKKKAVKKKAAKAPTKPLVADSAEELDELLAGLDGDGKDG